MRAEERALKLAALFLLAGFVVHNADHFRRGVDAVTPQVLWAGNVAAVMTVAAIAAALAGHRWAPILAVALGFPLALGVAAVHLLPHWSAFSDPLLGANADGLSIVASSLEIAGALALGVAGAWALYRGRRLDTAGAGAAPPTVPARR